MNFSFLKDLPRYELFADACCEAERTLRTSAAMCAVGCRKALELAVKWVYSADAHIKMPYKDNLGALVHEDTFRAAVPDGTWKKLGYVVRLGNQCVHTNKGIAGRDAVCSLKILFEFVQWVDYAYGGAAHVARAFDERAIPAVKLALDVQAIKQREALIAQKDEEIARLEAQVRAQQPTFEQAKAQQGQGDPFNPDEALEWETRQRYIDIDLRYAGWDFERNVVREVPVTGMTTPGGKGQVDYVLYGKDAKPLAVVEAKRTMYDPEKGLQQARLYADCLQAQYGRRPFVFVTNGFATRFCDDDSGPVRDCSGVFSPDDLQRLMNRRGRGLALARVRVDEGIAGRHYQVGAIRAVCEKMESGFRRHLLVMATGTGKTRTAAGLVDVLVRANRVTNVLFLADRLPLVSQAKAAFQKYLPAMSLCNLCECDNKAQGKDARIIFSTYPTILNAIDSVRTADDVRLFTPAHFDLIVIDEAHRSIFKKYRAIFEYFDAQLVGLTATPKDEVDRNTYDFFEVQRGVPTYVYTYEEAVERDHYLVPYRNIEVQTKFLGEGITYDDLSEEDRQRYDDDWEDAAGTEAPAFTPSESLNRWVFNEPTVDMVLQDLMENGIKVEGGERLGKTIVFAQNRHHAQLIVERFGKLYPSLARGGFIKRVVHTDDYAKTVIEGFKYKRLPVITVSVDMMDTGIDVPEALNLVFFKQVRSKTKFWQMIGRGTRTCEGIYATDCIDGEYPDKRRFFIFDYCGNFEFFRQGQDIAEGPAPESLSEKIFKRQAALAQGLQGAAFADEGHQALRERIVGELAGAVGALHDAPLVASVKLKLHAVEKFYPRAAYTCLTDSDVLELRGDIAPLVRIDDDDTLALRFDALMYGYMLAVVEGRAHDVYRKNLVSIASALQGKATIPQVKARLTLLSRICGQDCLEKAGVVTLEQVRSELRDLVKFLDEGAGRPAVYTSLTDPVLDRKWGEPVSTGEDFADYRLKVNRYVAEHQDDPAIYKLRINQPMSQDDFVRLERILTQELGNAGDYESAFGDTPFGLLVRRIAKLDHAAAMEAFAEFLNDTGLNQQQAAFMQKVVEYVENNGYMEPADLVKPPFDRPVPFVHLFDAGRQARLVALINRVKGNAERPAA